MPVTNLVSFTVPRVEVMDPAGVVDAALMPNLTPEQIHDLYVTMVTTRTLDDRMLKLQRQGRIGTFARVLGQEAAHIGATYALKKEDWLVPAFRETGSFLLRGIPPEKLLQYWAGDERGHDFPPGSRVLPISVPVGTHMLHAVGIGWAMKQSGERAVVLTVFGDGATSEGDFHEAMNFAAVFQAPVIFLCQNNQWAISVPYKRQTAAATIAQKAVAYGMPGIQVDGNDIFAMYRVAREAVDRARNGEGPTLIEAHTYRMSDHTTSDDARRYRTPEEVAFWQERDPVERLARYMRAAGLLDETSEAAVAAEAEAKVAGWVEAFEAVPPPEPDEIFRHVFAEPTPGLAAQRDELMGGLSATGEGR